MLTNDVKEALTIYLDAYEYRDKDWGGSHPDLRRAYETLCAFRDNQPPAPEEESNELLEEMRRAQRRKDTAYLFALTVWALMGTSTGAPAILEAFGATPAVVWMMTIIVSIFVGYFAGSLLALIRSGGTS